MEKKLGGIIVLAITLIIAIALSGILGSNNQAAQTLGNQSNETISITENEYYTLTNNDLIEVQSVINATTGVTMLSGNYTTDLTNGLINISSPDGDYYVAYTYYPDTYVKDTASRSLLDVMLIMFIIGIVITSFAYLKDTDMFEMFKK